MTSWRDEVISECVWGAPAAEGDTACVNTVGVCGLDGCLCLCTENFMKNETAQLIV